MRVDGRSEGHGEEYRQRSEMPLDMIIPYGLQINKSADIDKIENIGRGRRQYGYKSVYHIVLLLVNQQEHRRKRYQLENNGTNGNVTVLFQRFIQPLHSDGRQNNGKAHYYVKRSVVPESRNKNESKRKQGVGYNAHDQVYAEQLMYRAGQLPAVVSYL